MNSKLIITTVLLLGSLFIVGGPVVDNISDTIILDGSATVIITFDSFDSMLLSGIENMDIKINEAFSLIPAMEITLPISLLPIVSSIPGIKSVEENQIYQVSAIPNDPDYGQLWGMDKINAPAAWDIRTDASSVIVAVIDTGVQLSHPDLAANAWTNPGEIAGNGIDDDGNGYVDDINGWDFANNDASYYDSTADDHGTHVSGTIGGVGNNGIGVTGVSQSVKIMALKFLTATGGTTTDAITAIEYATMMGADIISASWGGGGYSQALKDAIDAFPGLFVAAAGNDGLNNDASPHYPSSYTSTNLIAVASTTSTDGMSSFSNYGVNSVDIGAPGSSIYSTWPSNTYNTISGTSMATPHVSGAAALVLAEDPTLTATQLKAKLMDFTDPISSLNGKTVSGGRLNVYAALTGTAPPPPPPPPPSTTETFTGSVSPDQVHYFDVPAAGDISATLNWGGSADVDMYLYGPGMDVTSSTNYLVRAYTVSNPENMAYSATTTGQYAIRVTLYSGATSSYTLDVAHPISPNPDTTAPSQVTGLSASAISTSQIDLSWSAASDNIGVTGYNVYRGGNLIATTTGTSYSDTGLNSGTTYSYSVSAFDAAGNEGTQSNAASATTNTPPPTDTTAPSQVTGLSASAISTSQIDLSWSAASDNVGVTGYNIYRGGNLIATTTGTSYSDTGLNSGTTYSYTVSAFDAAGNEGAQSNAASATTNTPPPSNDDVIMDNHVENVKSYKADKQKLKLKSTIDGTVSGSPTNIIISFDFDQALTFKKIKKVELTVNGGNIIDLAGDENVNGNTISIDITSYLADGDSFSLMIESEWKNVNPGTYSITGSISFFDGTTTIITSDTKQVSF